MTWFQQLSQKLVWAHRVIVTDSSNPVLKLDNGVSINLATNKISLEGNFALHVTGDLSLSADGIVTIRDALSKLPEDHFDPIFEVNNNGDPSGRSPSE